jgi:type IV pilus assembly protein PilY1
MRTRSDDMTAVRALLRAGAALALGLAAQGAAFAQYSISQVPMLVSSPPPPNIVLTIDDSGSMTWAYVPDIVGAGFGNPGFSNIAFTSSSFNPLYYNPTVTYPIPPDANGLAVPTAAAYAPGATAYAANAFTAAYQDGFNPDQGTVDLSTAYSPTFSYSPGGTPRSLTGTSGAAYYYVYVGGTGCYTPNPTLAPPPDTCFSQVVVSASSGPNGTDERQNFANWYAFYRTRHLALVSAAAQALQDPSLANARIAWQALNSCALPSTANTNTTSCSGWRGSPVFDNLNLISRFSGQHKQDFYNWLFQIPAGNSTPTRVAWWRTGNYFTTSGPNSPYGVDPNQTPTVQGSELLCVNNFQVTLTDGLWNTGNEKPQTAFCGMQYQQAACGNVDMAAATFPDGTAYQPAVTAASTTIYGDGADGGDSDISSGGLADIAFYYWANNLRPDLLGFNVPSYFPDKSTANPATGVSPDPTWPYWNPRNDPATWPHLVNFTVGVGLTGFLQLPGLVWSGDAHSGAAYTNLLTAAPNCTSPTICTWPDVDLNASGGGFSGANSGNGNVYDLWHAAINSRGNAFSASSPTDLVTAMDTIFTQVEGQTKGNSAAAGSSPSLVAGTQLFVASYDGSDWHGAITAYPINAATGAVGSSPSWVTSANSIAAFTTRAVFTASSGLPAGGGAIGTSPGIAFSPTALTTAGLISYFGASQPTQGNVVNYLLGDASNEQRNGGPYRSRTLTSLGDIVDSNPVFAWNEATATYQSLPEGQGSNSYMSFVASKASRPAMVYAGANDGMLHAFAAASGTEQFAYVPHSVIPNLTGLINPNYVHAFYVDGPIAVGDAFIGAGSGAASWHTVLVGTTGAGGRGVFALDVTAPQSFGAANVLWDMDGTTAPFGNGDLNLGFTIGAPQIARLNNGDWVAVFGNGYLSTRSCAVLYLVRLSDGFVRTIDTSGAGAGATGTCLNGAASNPNGLGSPTLLDMDQNGTTDFIYAGDLQGNLWKFDVSSISPGNWGVAYVNGSKPAPLYSAVTPGNVPQSISSAPNLGISNTTGNVLVYFATGHMFETGDPADTSVQSVYAVQDQGMPVKKSRGTNMVAQTLGPASDGSGNENVQLPYAPVNLALQDGWFVDLPGTGERVLTTPLLAGGMLLFSSVIPKSQPCAGGCGGFVYSLSAYNGDGATGFLIDPANGDAYDGLATEVGCIKGMTVITKASTLELYAVGNGSSTTGSTNPNNPNLPPPGGTTPTGPGAIGSTGIWQIQGQLNAPGRISWHEATP